MILVKLLGFMMLIGAVVRGVLKFQSAVDQIVAMQHKQEKAPQRRKADAEIIELSEYRSWKNAVNIYDITTGKERNA